MLSQSERDELDAALKRASAFERGEEMELMRQPLEGTLLKFTNPILQWQPRWFVLEPRSGNLRYYLKEEQKRGGEAKCRGSMVLAGATILPSDEDPHAFAVIPVQGDPFKLRASDTKHRSTWINRLRVVGQDHAERGLTSKAAQAASATSDLVGTRDVPDPAPDTAKASASKSSDKREGRKGRKASQGQDAAILHQLSRVSTAAAQQQAALAANIRRLEPSEDLLLVAASSAACLAALADSRSLLQSIAGQGPTRPPTPTQPLLQNIRLRPRAKASKASRASSVDTALPSDDPDQSFRPTADVEGLGDLFEVMCEDVPPMGEDDEVAEDIPETELGSVDDFKGEILALLSPLKLGTDLTRVCFPSFCLRPQSLLESCADFLAGGWLLGEAARAKTAEARLALVARWYVWGFQRALRCGLARKPLNPLQDEVFQCRWEWEKEGGGERRQMSVYAEQVSHQPGVSAFFAEGPDARLSGYLWPRARFMGMNITATLVGELQLALCLPGGKEEVYRMGFPTLYGRSILTTPWLELGGKVGLSCEASGTSASVAFHTKPFYGGRSHRVTAELRDAAGQEFASLDGEWTGELALKRTKPASEAKTASLGDDSWSSEDWRGQKWLSGGSVGRESRRLWASVGSALGAGDSEAASRAKAALEEAQRVRLAADHRRPASPFRPTPDSGWLHHRFPAPSS